jgi:hypothetical protein
MAQATDLGQTISAPGGTVKLALGRLEKALGQLGEEGAPRYDALEPPLVHDGQDQHAVVEEGLGYLNVGRVGRNLHVLGVHMLPDRLGATGSALLEDVVQFLPHESGEVELLDVAREESGHELPLPEDARKVALPIEHGECGKATVEDRPDRLCDWSVIAKGRGFADEGSTDGLGAHR